MHKNTIKKIERMLDDYFFKNELSKEKIWKKDEELKQIKNGIKKVSLLVKISEEEVQNIFNNYYHSNIIIEKWKKK